MEFARAGRGSGQRVYRYERLGIDTGIVDRTVATLGVDRVLFATDGILEEGVGKLLEANLDEADRARVFGGNVREIFARRRG